MQGSGLDLGVGPLVFAGQVNLHGNGTLDGTDTISDNGSILSRQKVSGAYKIAKGCFGVAVITVGTQGPIHLYLFTSPGEQKVFFIQTDANTLLSGTLHQ